MFLNASHLYNMCFEGFASPLLSLLVHWYLLYVMYAFYYYNYYYNYYYCRHFSRRNFATV